MVIGTGRVATYFPASAVTMCLRLFGALRRVGAAFFFFFPGVLVMTGERAAAQFVPSRASCSACHRATTRRHGKQLAASASRHRFELADRALDRSAGACRFVLASSWAQSKTQWLKTLPVCIPVGRAR